MLVHVATSTSCFVHAKMTDVLVDLQSSNVSWFSKTVRILLLTSKMLVLTQMHGQVAIIDKYVTANHNSM